jgi:REP element-mobilizing transposase RayT
MSSGVYNKYTGYNNRRSIRLPGYDYSRPGYYFVTICIYDHKQKLFGDVACGKMILNEYGKCAEQCFRNIPHHFPNVNIDEFVVMPNHVHGIICIRDASVGANNHSPLPVAPSLPWG